LKLTFCLWDAQKHLSKVLPALQVRQAPQAAHLALLGLLALKVQLGPQVRAALEQRVQQAQLA
jgi:hypothetical protein